MDALGYWTWVFHFFGENFMPVFKVFWSVVLFLGNGNYHAFLFASFIMHALVVFLLGYLLRMWSLGLFPVLFCQLVLALNYTHIEILSQSIQISNLMSYSFFLILVIVFSRLVMNDRPCSLNYCWFISLLASLGALSFARGILNGVAVFGVVLLFGIIKDVRYKRLLIPALFALVPSLILGFLSALWVYHNTSSGLAEGLQLKKTGVHFFYQLS
jgi:hypothetical protein